MSAWSVYFILILDSIIRASFVATVLTGILLMVGVIGVSVNIAEKFQWGDIAEKFHWRDEERQAECDKCDKWVTWFREAFSRRIYFCVFFVSLFLLIFLPTTKQATVLYLLPKIVNNEDVQQIPSNAMKLLNGKMQEWLSEMEEKVKK